MVFNDHKSLSFKELQEITNMGACGRTLAAIEVGGSCLNQLFLTDEQELQRSLLSMSLGKIRIMTKSIKVGSVFSLSVSQRTSDLTCLRVKR